MKIDVPLLEYLLKKAVTAVPHGQPASASPISNLVDGEKEQSSVDEVTNDKDAVPQDSKDEVDAIFSNVMPDINEEQKAQDSTPVQSQFGKSASLWDVLVYNCRK